MRYKILKPRCIYERGTKQKQEDCMFPLPGRSSESDRLFIVCDGVGSKKDADYASRITANTIASYFSLHHSADRVATDNLLHDALVTAYKKLNEADNGDGSEMATTMALLYMHRGGCLAAHIGNSRIYHVRPSQGEILYRSIDHTDAEGKKLTRAIMTRQKGMARPEIVHITDIKPGDFFMLFTAGMFEKGLTDGQIVEILKMDNTDDDKLRIFTAACANNHDNHSAFIIHVNGIARESIDKVVPTVQKVQNNQTATDSLGNENDETTSEQDSSISSTNTDTPVALSDQDDSTSMQSEPQTETSRHPIVSRIVTLLLALVVLSALGFLGWKFFYQNDKPDTKAGKVLTTDSVKAVTNTMNANSDSVYIGDGGGGESSVASSDNGSPIRVGNNGITGRQRGRDIVNYSSDDYATPSASDDVTTSEGEGSTTAQPVAEQPAETPNTEEKANTEETQQQQYPAARSHRDQQQRRYPPPPAGNNNRRRTPAPSTGNSSHGSGEDFTIDIN
ncbi:MAG: protein phosphatase 2C domain-containing protein [Prevotella sp.]|nr:protein phosphatase 2C domain-containing protein [Prevotella sp.]